MGTVHPPRDKQTHLDKPSLWLDQPAEEFLSLENIFRKDEPSLGGKEFIEKICSPLEEHTRLRKLFGQLSDLKTSVNQDKQLP